MMCRWWWIDIMAIIIIALATTRADAPPLEWQQTTSF